MQPGQLGNGVSNDGDIMRMIQDLQRQVRELAAANPFATMGLTPLPNALQVDGELDVKGPLSVDGAATFGGTTTIGGNAAITGTLSLPAGIIDNAALTDPLLPITFHADAQNFALSNGPNIPVVSTTVTVPAGYSRAMVSSTTNISAANTTGANDTLYCGLLINGVGPGYSGRVGVSPGAAGSVGKAGAALLTGLGSSFTINGTGSTFVANWAADPNTNANLDGFVIFLR